ncbi:hypothetical protein [Planctomyces sp. SH-PL62]|uniref:hypothetical protein n=1 Tax=Planctomyces sp. SH-PL62 TaxID=1636152 RepID=UPI00078E4B20|nr:hypothetical protein [Planctomyces sp. SH-PL62]AMV35983.1 hypothetical protein VT85_00965 [Planctomyces sp. SH-PL62]
MRANWGFSAVASRRAVLGCLAAGLAGAWGCNPRKDQIRPDNLLGRIGNRQGEIIEPKKCALRMAVVTRPFRDPVVNEIAWRAVDEQSVAPEERLALQANGIRMGRITGDLPRELEALLNAPPPHKVEPITFLVPEGTQELLTVCDKVDQASLLLNLDRRVTGKDYSEASGFYRVTPEHYESGSVSLRLTPEIHHGDVQRSYQPLQQPSPYSPQEFKIADGQQQESLRDLTANLVVEPDQAVVLGCLPDQERSLGAFLFTASADHPDRRSQRLVLIWAGRNQLGVLEEKPSKIVGDVAAQPGADLATARPTPAKDEAAR